MKIRCSLLLLLAACQAPPQRRPERPCGWASIGDLVQLEGEDTASLRAYGVVVGLNGTGDSPKGESARMAERLLPGEGLQARSFALVVVNAELGACRESPSSFEVRVSALGDAGSLEGGMLLPTPLRGNHRIVYGTAAGPVVVDPTLTAGTIPGGGWLTRPLGLVKGEAGGNPYVTLVRPYGACVDAEEIADRLGGTARVSGEDAIDVFLPGGEPTPYISRLMKIRVPLKRLPVSAVFIDDEGRSLRWDAGILLAPGLAVVENLVIRIRGADTRLDEVLEEVGPGFERRRSAVLALKEAGLLRAPIVWASEE